MPDTHSQCEQGRQDSTSELQLSISNIRPKPQSVAGVDLSQSPMNLFDAAIADGDLTLARDALLAFRQETEISSRQETRTSDSSQHSTVHPSSASEIVDNQPNISSNTIESGSTVATARSQGGRLEKLILDIETEVRAEYEANWRKSVETLAELEEALSKKTTNVETLEQQVAQLEDAVVLQRDNHNDQVEQLTTEYEQQLTTLQDRNQQLLGEYDRRIDELTVSRESTLDELEAAWNAIAADKQRWQTESETRRLQWDQQKLKEQEAFTQQIRKQEAALEQRQSEVEGELMKQKAQLDLEREQLKSSQSNSNKEHELAIQRLTTEREVFDHDRESWKSRAEQERIEMTSLRETHEQELVRIRAEISRERAEWDATRERKTSTLNSDLAAHQKSVEDARRELNELVHQHEDAEQDHAEKLGSFEQTFNERANRQRVELEQELLSRRSAWRDEEERERTRLRSEKDSLSVAVEQLQMLLARRRQEHDAELGKMRLECEQSNRDWSSAERDRIEREFGAARQTIVDAEASFDHKCNEWAKKRDEEAALLRTEQERLNGETESVKASEGELDAERSRLDAQITQLKSDTEKLSAQNAQAKAEIEKERAESERLLHQERQTHFEELQTRQTEAARHQSIVDEKIRQQEHEWAERQRQVEHDLESRRLLHQREIENQSAQWAEIAKNRRAELDAEERAIREQQVQLESQRARHQSEIEEANRKLANDRHMLQDGLTQMDAQLKWVATHLGSEDIIPFQPRESLSNTPKGIDSTSIELSPAVSSEVIRSESPADEVVRETSAETEVEHDVVVELETSQETDEPHQATATPASETDLEVAYADVVEPDDFEKIDLKKPDESQSTIASDMGDSISDVEDTLKFTTNIDANDFQDASDHYVDPESVAPELVEQGWVEKVREVSELKIAEPIESRIPTGGETEWAGVVESVYVRSMNHASQADDDSVDEETNDVEESVESQSDACDDIDTELAESDNDEIEDEIEVEVSIAETELEEDESVDEISADQEITDAEEDVENEDVETEVAGAQGTESTEPERFHRIDDEPSSRESDSERRKALKDYRVKLLDLQAQLGSLDDLAEQNSVDE
jgi:hypothetical protein